MKKITSKTSEERKLVLCEEAKLAKKIFAKEVSLERKYKKMKDKRISDLDERKDKELKRFISKAQKKHKADLNNKIRKLRGHKKPGTEKKDTENIGLTVAQKNRSFTKTMHLCIVPTQRLAVLKRCDKNNKGQCSCCGIWRDRSKLYGGHARPKQRYMNIAFELTNIRPICGMCNKRQGNNYATEWHESFLLLIGQEEWDRLKGLSLLPPSYTKADMYEYREIARKELEKEKKKRGL